MSITIASIISNTDTYFGDSTTDRVSQSERLQAITEASAWLLEELGNEHMVDTYDLDYLDTVNRYKVTTPLADLLVGADLRRQGEEHIVSFTRKSAREIAEEIGQRDVNPSWAVERYGADSFLFVHAPTKNRAIVVSDFESLTDGEGTWVVDSTNSDATNLTLDNNEYKNGSGSLNFDVDVSQSGNNRSTIYLPGTSERDLSSVEDLGSFLFWVYLPAVSTFSSITFYWGVGASTVSPATRANYWSATVTTDINGSAFVAGWNECKIDWENATVTGTPDASGLTYFEFAFNYTAGQVDDTDFRIDYLRVAKPEKLTFHYVSWYVGTNSGGTSITSFTATSDIPFFSGKYDQYRYVVAHKSASILFSAIRLRDEAIGEEAHARNALDRYRKNFESSKAPEEKSFKIPGVNLRRSNRKAKIRNR